MSKTITISVLGVSGTERVKGAQGVGKSLFCNRFVRGAYDDFQPEHSSILSQTDFCSSPVINNDHWLYWGERQMDIDEHGTVAQFRIIEQTEFLDDISFEPIAGPSTAEAYCKRAVKLRLESRDKLMYLQKEQLGLEAEFPQQILPDGKCTVDGFIYVFDVSFVDGRSFEKQADTAATILLNALKTKRPILLVASKSDEETEGGRKTLQKLLQRKELKPLSTSLVEVSSMKNVNVEEAFLCIGQQILKTKNRSRILPFPDAFRIVNQQALDSRSSFIRLLNSALPLDEWPTKRVSWSRLLAEFAVDRHRDFANFVRTFGFAAAQQQYEQHVTEAREHWMRMKIRALVPQLPRVFAGLLDKRELLSLCWSEANERIHTHPLFDEFFLPLGALGKQLEPLSPEETHYAGARSIRADPRIPAEILLRTEARAAYEHFQQLVEQEQRKERMEEEFENILAECQQVTPGRPLQDVCLFLQGCSAYDSLAPAQAQMVYDRYQTELVKRAEADFAECLLENIEMFVEIVRRRRREPHQERAFSLTEGDMAIVRTVLQDDVRYRQLSRLWELRDGMTVRFVKFIAHPLAQSCPSTRSRCMDTLVPEQIASFFARRRQDELENSAHIVKIVVHGDLGLVAQFITDVACILHGAPFQSACGLAVIHCIGWTGDEDEQQNAELSNYTQLYLLDSAAAVEVSRRKQSGHHTDAVLPPIYVLVCDPSHYDLMPFLHHQGALLADQTGGIFIGSGSSDTDSGRSMTSDNSSIFGRDQLFRILDVACGSQLESRRPDVRVRVSLLCVDPHPTDTILASMLDPSSMKPVMHQNFIHAGLVPVDAAIPSYHRPVRVDVRFGSYHSWIASKHNCPTHGHILVYSARRMASWAHARAAVCRIIEDGAHSVTGKAILLVAVTDISDYCTGQENNVLVTEGSELADCIGATFLCIPQDSSPERSSAFIDFFDRIFSMVPLLNPIYGTGTASSYASRGESDGYATLSDVRGSGAAREPHQSGVDSDEQQPSSSSRKEVNAGNSVSTEAVNNNDYGAQTRNRSFGTMVSDSSSASRESTLSTSIYPHRVHVTSAASEYPSSGRSSSGGGVGRTSASPLRQVNLPAANRPPSGASSAPSTNGAATGPPRQVRRRIAPAPPAPLYISKAVMEEEKAPLATPELIDIATEYSVVQDDEHMYATLDHAMTEKPRNQAIVSGKRSPKTVKRNNRPRGGVAQKINNAQQSPNEVQSTPSSAGAAATTSNGEFYRMRAIKMPKSTSAAGVASRTSSAEARVAATVRPQSSMELRNNYLSTSATTSVPNPQELRPQQGPKRSVTTANCAAFLSNAASVPDRPAATLGRTQNDKRVTSQAKTTSILETRGCSPSTSTSSGRGSVKGGGPRSTATSAASSPGTAPRDGVVVRVKKQAQSSMASGVTNAFNRLSRSNFLGARSATMDFISRPSPKKVEAATLTGQVRTARNVKEKRTATAPMTTSMTTGVRQSVSAESLNGLLEENKKIKKKRTGEIGFVRKVTSSFRFRGSGNSGSAVINGPVRALTDGKYDKENQLSVEQPVAATTSQAQQPQSIGILKKTISGVRSVPHSPHTERKPKPSSEKVSNAFSWLPSRSPKRTGRAVSAEIQPVPEGKNLESLAAKSGGIPAFITRCVAYIETEGGLELEGLYRVPGNQSQLADVERQFNGNSEIDLSGMELPVHVVATALKNFFAQLSDPLIPHLVHDKLVEAVIPGDDVTTSQNMCRVLSQLSMTNRRTLSYFLAHLRRVAASQATAMDARNLSKVWWPTLFRPQFNSFDAMTSGTARLQKTAEALFLLSDKIFPEDR